MHESSFIEAQDLSDTSKWKYSIPIMNLGSMIKARMRKNGSGKLYKYPEVVEESLWYAPLRAIHEKTGSVRCIYRVNWYVMGVDIGFEDKVWITYICGSFIVMGTNEEDKCGYNYLRVRDGDSPG